MSIIQDVQYRIKATSSGFFIFALRLLSGLFLGFGLTIISHEILQYGQFIYWFIFVLTTALFLKVSRSWGPWGIVIFNLVCLLVGMLLRMYILIAPGD